MEDQAAEQPKQTVEAKAPLNPGPKKPVRKSRRQSLILVIFLVVAVAAAAFFYSKYQDSQDKLKHPEILAKAETQSLIARVGRHVELPSGTPTIATVSDVSKLSSQTFFAKAKNGDKVLIYSSAKQAILYRPSEDRVINIAPLNINAQNTR